MPLKDKQKQVEYRKKRRAAIRKKLYEYVQENPCTDCGETDPIVLQFDHISGNKNQDISRMISNANSWMTILQEISLCEVVCANCHQRRTAKAQKWYSSLKKSKKKYV